MLGWHSLLAAGTNASPSVMAKLSALEVALGQGPNKPTPGTSSAFLLLAFLFFAFPAAFRRESRRADDTQVRTENHLKKSKKKGFYKSERLECCIATTGMFAFLIRQLMVSRCMGK